MKWAKTVENLAIWWMSPLQLLEKMQSDWEVGVSMQTLLNDESQESAELKGLDDTEQNKTPPKSSDCLHRCDKCYDVARFLEQNKDVLPSIHSDEIKADLSEGDAALAEAKDLLVKGE